MSAMKTQKITAVFTLSALFVFFACEKKETIIIPPNTDVPTELIIDARVPAVIYSNKKDMTLDASKMAETYVNRGLKYLWTCTQFPVGRAPFIMYPESVSTPVEKLDTGKYTIHLRAGDKFGNEANADYQLIVYQDTLSGPPVVPLMPAKVYTLPEQVILISNVAAVNPVNRVLSFNWTVIEQPAGSPALNIMSNSAYSDALVLGCVSGKYTFQLEVTNELNLKATGVLEVTILADPLAGLTKVYENLRWSIFDDEMGGTFLGIYVREPQTSFFNRNKSNTEISLWDFTSQVWMTPNSLSWSGYDEGVMISNYPQVNSITDGTPGKVRITFK